MNATAVEQEIEQDLRSIYTNEELFEKFEYLTNDARGRGNYVSQETLRFKIYNQQLTGLIKRLDPIAYNYLSKEL